MNQLLHTVTKSERVDESFYFDTKSSYQLTIQIEDGYFKAVAYSNEREKFVMQADFKFDNEESTLQEIIEKTDFLHRDYVDVRCIINSAQHTLIPKPLFSKNDSELWLSFNANLAPDHIIYHNFIPAIDSYVVYGIRSTIVAMVRRKFPEVKFIHTASTLVSYSINHFRSTTQPTLLINAHSNTLDVCLIKENKLLLFNSYSFQSPEDFIYYPLFITEQFQLNTENLLVKVSGLINKEMNEFQMLWKYFQFVDFCGKDSRSEYSYRLDGEMNTHQFLTLFAARLCE